MDDYGYEREARLYRAFAELRRKPLKEQIVIMFVTTVLCFYLWFIYDYVYYCLNKFGFFGTLPFWFIGYLFTYYIFDLASSNNVGNYFVFRSACLGIDMAVLSGYMFGHMTFKGWLMLAVGIGLILGLIVSMLIECVVDKNKKDSKTSTDSILLATINRKVMVYSLIFLVCMSIINSIYPRF